MNECQYYKKLNNSLVKCELCPKECNIEPSKLGDCLARRNINGKLKSEVYGRIAALNMDRIEKKPFYHYYPGREILSVGTKGCNLHCLFCQNHTLSQCQTHRSNLVKEISPIELIDLAQNTPNNLGIAFTYNEPTINFEFVLETAKLAKKTPLKTVLVSNGYINEKPLNELIKVINAFNIDLKSFDNNFYKKISKGTLPPVLNSIKRIAESNKHLEITNLIIPTFNDNEKLFESMCKWIAEETGQDTVLHLSRYFPRHLLKQYPTPPETLFRLYDIAKNILHNTYIGNMPTELHGTTFCPTCNKKVIERTYFTPSLTGLTKKGQCKNCQTQIIKAL